MYISLLLVATVLSCTKNDSLPTPQEDMLYRVECFYLNHPDSALRILDTLNVAALSKKEMAHYCLLRVDIRFKLGLVDSESDSLLKIAEDCFLGSDDKYYEAKTFKTKAYVNCYYSTNRKSLIDYMLKAKQTVDQCTRLDERLVLYSLTPTTEEDEIDRVKYKIHTSLGSAYCELGYLREGIELLKETDSVFIEKQWLYEHCRASQMLGNGYLILHEFDSSMMYLARNLQAAEMLGDVESQAESHSSIAMHLLYRYDKQKDMTDDERQGLLQQAIAEEKQALRIAEGLVYRDKLWAIDGLSHAYFELKQYDSCIHYAKQALELHGRSSWKMNANRYLYKSYEALGDYENALLYARKYMDMKSNYDNSGKGVAEIKDDYDRQLELQRVESEQQRKRLTLYLLISVLVIVLLLLWLFISNYRSTKEMEVMRLREAQRNLQSAFDQSDRRNLEMLQQRVMDIYQSGGKDRMQHILEAMDEAYPQATARLKAAYPVLSEPEVNACVLSFFSFRLKETADIMGLRDNTVAKHRTSIKKKTQTTDLECLMKPFLH